MELWRAYDRLCQVVLRAEAMLSRLKLPRARCPGRADLVVVFELARVVATALVDFLEDVDLKLGLAREAGALEPACIEVWEFLREVEGLRDDGAGRLPLVWGVVVRIHRLYGLQVELDHHLSEHRIPTTFAWRENVQLWQSLVYDGAIPHLGMIPLELELHDRSQGRAGSDPAGPAGGDDLCSGRVTSFRREQGFGVITLDDGWDIQFDAGRCTMVPEPGDAVRLRVGPAHDGGLAALHVEPPEPSIPRGAASEVGRVPMRWRHRAILGLLWLAGEAEFLATAHPAAFLARERRVMGRS